MSLLFIILLFLSTSVVGWLYVFVYTIIVQTAAPTWAAPLAEVSSAASLALFGTLLGIREMGLHKPHPQIDVSVIRVPSEGDLETPHIDLTIRATVSIHPGQAPIRLRTFKGVIEPLWDEASTKSTPVLLKPDPAAVDLAVESFSYTSRFIPQPPATGFLRVTLFLVTDDGSRVVAFRVRPNGGWRESNWLERWRDARWLRKQGKRRAKAMKGWRE